MKRFDRKFTAVLLSLFMILSLMTMTAFAVGEVTDPDNDAAVTEQAAEPDTQAEDTSASEDPATEDVTAAPTDEPEGAVQDEKSEEPETPEDVAFSDSAVVDGVKITVTADKGVFPEGARLIARKATAAEEKQAEEAVAEAGGGINVMASYTFDISVVDKDGNEIQPDNSKGETKVSFTTEEVADEDLDTAVYHMDGNEAEELDVAEKGKTATVETEGFSLYCVQFTYEPSGGPTHYYYVSEYDNFKDSGIILSSVFNRLGIGESTGDVTEGPTSDPSNAITVTQLGYNNNKDYLIRLNSSFNPGENQEIKIRTGFGYPNNRRYVDIVFRMTSKKVDITFEPNFETSKMENQVVEKGTPFKLKKNEYNREGYEFRCWTDGKGNEYTDEENVTFHYSESEVTLTAQWREIVNPTKLSIEGWTYGDTPSKPQLEGYSGTDVEYTYAPADSEDYSPTVPTTAGDYKLKATIPLKPEHTDWSDTCSFTISPKPLTITAGSDEKEYDGTALTKDSYSASGLAAGDKVVYAKVTGSQTVAGWSYNVVSDEPGDVIIKNNDGEGEDVTSNYVITPAKGTLTVTKKPLTITADSETKEYDGTALTKNSYTNTELAATDSIESVTVTGSRTVAGESANKPSAAKIVNKDVGDVTASYNITYVDGKLTVTQKPLTITANNCTKTYDGIALTSDAYSYTELAEGDKIESVIFIGTQTTAGSSPNIPSTAVIKNAGGTDVSDCYNCNYIKGTLKVNRKALTITADSDEKVYDGKELTKDSYTNTALATGDSIKSVTVTGSQKNVGTSPNKPSDAEIKNGDGDDVTASYQITYTDGTLEVTKALTNKVTLEIKGWTYGDTPNAPKVTTQFGEATITYSDASGHFTTDVPTTAGKWYVKAEVAGTANYVGGEAGGVNEKGLFTISPKEIGLEWYDTSFTYDGNYHKPQVKVTGLVEGDSCNVGVDGEAKDAGSYLAEATGPDNHNYTLPKNPYGDFTISKAGLTVTADAKSKTYGTTDPVLTYSSSGLVAGDRISGSLTRDGGEDTGLYAIKQGSLTAGKNYDIRFTGASLKIWADKSALNASIASAQNYSNSISSSYPAIAVSLNNAIGAARAVSQAEDPSQAYVNNARIALDGAVTAAVIQVAAADEAARAAEKAAIYSPAKVKLKKVSKGSKSLTASFKRLDNNVSGYQVMVTNTKTGEVKTVNAKQSKKSVKTIDKTVKKLAKKTKYSVQVRAYNVVGSETYFGEWSDAKTAKTY